MQLDTNRILTTMLNNFDCPIMSTIAMISDKWKVLILCKLRNGKQRFNELRRSLQGVTQRVLTHQLRDLEADGLIKRTIYAEVPPRVEYELTPLGATLMPALESLEVWAQDHWEELAKVRALKAADNINCRV
jgi:DNA-binding HxlR family transcriptional regulator